MPKQSYRSQAIAKILGNYERAKALFVVDQLLDSDCDSDSVSIDLDSPSFLTYLSSKSKLDTAINTRYIKNRMTRKSPVEIFEHDLHEEEDGTHWINDDEFKMKYRMSREMLDSVTDIIKDSKVFKKGKRGPSQRPVKHQLMVFLHFLGQEGQNDQSQRNVFHISRGSCRLCRDRVVKALVSKRDEFIR